MAYPGITRGVSRKIFLLRPEEVAHASSSVIDFSISTLHLLQPAQPRPNLLRAKKELNISQSYNSSSHDFFAIAWWEYGWNAFYFDVG